jgi:hypothetical protein
MSDMLHDTAHFLQDRMWYTQLHPLAEIMGFTISFPPHYFNTYTNYAYAKIHYCLARFQERSFGLFVPNEHSPLMQRFPGRGHVLGSSGARPPSPVRAPVITGSRRPKPSSNQTELQARLLDPSSPVSAPEVLQQTPPTSSPHNRLTAERITWTSLALMHCL